MRDASIPAEYNPNNILCNAKKGNSEGFSFYASVGLAVLVGGKSKGHCKDIWSMMHVWAYTIACYRDAVAADITAFNEKAECKFIN